MKTLLHLCRVVVGIDDADTQVTERELALLVSSAEEAKVAVEIGTFEGRTTLALASAVKGTIYTIDPFIPGRLGICYSEGIARLLRRRSRLTNIVFLKGLSHDVAGRFDHPIDFMFIDADHSYEGVRRDWDDWFPKVTPGGIIALHDSRIAPNSPFPLGSMTFYEKDVRQMTCVSEIAAADSLVVLQKQSA